MEVQVTHFFSSFFSSLKFPVAPQQVDICSPRGGGCRCRRRRVAGQVRHLAEQSSNTIAEQCSNTTTSTHQLVTVTVTRPSNMHAGTCQRPQAALAAARRRADLEPAASTVATRLPRPRISCSLAPHRMPPATGEWRRTVSHLTGPVRPDWRASPRAPVAG